MSKLIREALIYMGYRKKINELDKEIYNEIVEVLNDIKKTANISYITKDFDIINENECINLINSNVKFDSKNLSKLLKDSKKITIAAVTLGLELDKKIKKFTYTDMSKAVIYDACASAIIEEKCDELENMIINNFPEHFLTNRFSPGYGDLELNNQKKIINLLQTEKKIGLTLTSGNLMIPQKSVTFIVGITEVEKCISKNKCDRCNAKCEFRVKTRK